MIRHYQSAFPNQPCGRDGLPTHEPEPGLDVRDWFASHALPQAVLDYDRRDRGNPVLPHAAKPIGTREDIIAWQAYRYADAMLRARERADNETSAE